MNHSSYSSNFITLEKILDKQDYLLEEKGNLFLENFSRGIFFIKEYLIDYYQYLSEQEKETLKSRINQQTIKVNQYHDFFKGYKERLLK